MSNLLENLKTALALIGLGTIVFVVFCAINFVPAKSMHTLPEQLQQVLMWTGRNAVVLLAIFASLVVAYALLKIVMWLRKRDHGFGGPSL